MPVEHSPTRKESGEDPEPASTPATGAVPKTNPSGGDPPATPSKGITKMSKAELLNFLSEYRAHLGMETDAQTKATYNAYTKDRLVEEYFTLKKATEAPNPKQASSEQSELAAMFMASRRDNDRAINEANRRMDIMLENMDRQRHEAEERVERQQREMERQRHESDARFADLLKTLGAALHERAPEARLEEEREERAAPPAAPAQPRGPRTFDYTAVSQLSQDSTYREFKEWHETWTNNARVKQFSTFDRETQVYSIVSAAGPHASRVLKTHLAIDLDSNTTTADTVMNGLQAYFRDQRSVVVDRVAFRKCRQKANETFDEFRFRLVDLADDADLCEA